MHVGAAINTLDGIFSYCYKHLVHGRFAEKVPRDGKLFVNDKISNMFRKDPVTGAEQLM
jgi:hypothetical protein